MMHSHHRPINGLTQGFGKGHADQQSTNQPGALGHGNHIKVNGLTATSFKSRLHHGQNSHGMFTGRDLGHHSAKPLLESG
jgi:hypothetical protein